MGQIVLLHVTCQWNHDHVRFLYEKENSLEGAVRQIEIFDTGVAFLAGLMIIPAVFAFSGGDESALSAGPGLMFITLPKVFNSMPAGGLIGALFSSWFFLQHSHPLSP